MEKTSRLDIFADEIYTKQEVKRIIIYTLAVIGIVLSVQSCANMAQGPTGGYRDTVPPSVTESNPRMNAIRQKGNKIEIYFDEYISLSNASRSLMVSPTQTRPFIAKGIGKKVSVELRDSLIPNTTYTFDFGNSIVDYNESNPIKDFHFSFSTGESLDTMSVSGTVLDAHDLTPVKDVFVGVYSDLEDSAFTSGKLERIAMTDADGHFVLYNLAAKPYRIYALKDINNNKYFDQRTEAVAVSFEPIVPKVEPILNVDTFYRDSVTIDTIVQRTAYRYYPDSIVLRMFNEDLRQQFFEKAERKSEENITLYFKNFAKIEPKLTPLNFDSADWLLEMPSVTKDTFIYWIKDTVLAKMDTLRFALEYQKFDSSETLVPQVDTISVVFLHEKKRKSRKRDADVEPVEFLKVSKFSSVVEINKDAFLEWERPVFSFSEENMKVRQLVDSNWVDVKYNLQPRDAMSYYVKFDMESGVEYKLELDSAAVTDIRGLHNDKIALKIRKKGEDEYAKLMMEIKNAPSNSKVELLRGTAVVKSIGLNAEGKAVFENVDPNEYSVRLFVDANGDGKWTTGRYADRLLPEEVYYFEKLLKLRPNWDMEEVWDVKALPLTKQKPQKEAAKKK